jgi:hypothetical protein
MKLKILGLLMTSVFASASYAEAINRLVCKGENMGSMGFQIDIKLGAAGYIAYNYSSATVICPGSLEYRLSEHKSIRCNGSWSYDLDKNHHSTDTAAWIEIYNDGRNITARSQTNKVYGSRIINLNCNIEKYNTATGRTL